MHPRKVSVDCRDRMIDFIGDLDYLSTSALRRSESKMSASKHTAKLTSRPALRNGLGLRLRPRSLGLRLFRRTGRAL